ncbi:MAG: hypothetical protein HY889_07450 [Deltaproteobacteria bacterium]|nr:hypothetical protein [Deltaproteobacteria bacterium]
MKKQNEKTVCRMPWWNNIIKTARKPWPFKARDEWPPVAKPVFVGEAEELSPLAVYRNLGLKPKVVN